MSQSKDTKSDNKGFDYVRSAMDDYPAPTRVAISIILFLIWVFFKIFYPWRIENEESFVKELKGGGCMVIQNHVSMVEPVVMIVSLWRHGIHVRPLYKLEFEKIGAAKWLFRRAGAIPVNRGAADMRAIRAAKDALLRGECVLVYPEGTRIKSDDDAVDLHGGFAMIAQMANACVIPTAVVGAADPYKTRKTIRKKPVITTGAALTFEAMGKDTRKEQQEALESCAIEQMYALRDELRANNPGLW